MSGKALGFQFSWQAVFQALDADSSHQTAAAIADANNRQIEEFISAYVVTLDADNNVTLPGRLLLADGTVSSLALSWTNDDNTGLYRYGQNSIGFVTTGTLRWRMENASLLIGSSDDGIGAVTGGYGSIQTVGSGTGGWEGYSINGWAVFMADSGGTGGRAGLYNDVDDEWYLYGTRNGELRLFDNGVETMRIDSDTLCRGGFHVNDGALLDEAGAGMSYTGTEFVTFYRETTNTAHGIMSGRSDVSGTKVLQHVLYANGSTGNRLNSYGAISDERLKTNMTPYGDPRQDLLDIPVINYQFSGYFDRDGEIQETDDLGPVLLGWGAQTVQKIKPGLVQEDEESGQLMVKASVFVPMLHRAFQLDHAHLQDIEARLQAAGL